MTPKPPQESDLAYTEVLTAPSTTDDAEEQESIGTVVTKQIFGIHANDPDQSGGYLS